MKILNRIIILLFLVCSCNTILDTNEQIYQHFFSSFIPDYKLSELKDIGNNRLEVNGKGYYINKSSLDIITDVKKDDLNIVFYTKDYSKILFEKNNNAKRKVIFILEIDSQIVSCNYYTPQIQIDYEDEKVKIVIDEFSNYFNCVEFIGYKKETVMESSQTSKDKIITNIYIDENNELSITINDYKQLIENQTLRLVLRDTSLK